MKVRIGFLAYGMDYKALMFSLRLTAPIPSAITETALNAQMKALTTLDTRNCSRLW